MRISKCKSIVLENDFQAFYNELLEMKEKGFTHVEIINIDGEYYLERIYYKEEDVSHKDKFMPCGILSKFFYEIDDRVNWLENYFNV